MASGIVTQSYVVTDLTPGVTYDFKVEARNSHGHGAFSDTITLLNAFKPEAPITISTTISGPNVIIQWSDPVDNGSPITGYRIHIRENGSTVYTQESVECDGTNADVIANRQCIVSLFTLIEDPYNLVLHESIDVKVISENFYGDSPLSASGNGATMQLVPDAPINLTNDPSVTSDTTVRFTWTEGPSNGGSPVIDFDVYYDQATDNFVLLEANVGTAHYTTNVPLNPGLTYSFYVRARNSVGVSLNSDPITILVAKAPDAPINLQNVPALTTGYQVGLDWEEGPYNGASPVIDYRVQYKPVGDSTYQIFASGVVASDIIVTGLTPSVTYSFYVEARNIINFSVPSTVVEILAA